MNFALSSIIIIILLLPGAVFLKSYYTSFIAKEKSIATPILDSLLLGLFCSIFLHSAALCIIHWLGYEVKLSFLYNVISGKDTKDFDPRGVYFLDYVRDFFFYTIILITIAYFIAKGFKYLVHMYRLDQSYSGLINYNYWFSIFGDKFIPPDVDLIYIDVMTSENQLYSGVLSDFVYCSKKDELETLVLKGATRRVINEDQEISDPIEIPGHVFVLKVKDLLNINVKYINVSEIIEGNVSAQG